MITLSPYHIQMQTQNQTGKVTIFWFRRDLRLEDNCGLYQAHREQHPVQPVFIFDRAILNRLKNKKNARIEFIRRELSRLQDELQARGAALDVRIGNPLDVWRALCADYVIGSVWVNRDYTPYATRRDQAISALLQDQGVPFTTVKDHTLFEWNEILKKDGSPYLVYTPYSKTWKERLTQRQLLPFPSAAQHNWLPRAGKPLPGLRQLGFKPAGIEFPPRKPDRNIIRNYHKTRDLPALHGTTRMGVHLRFGTISIRELAALAVQTNETYLNELIWRDFYQAILRHFPRSATHNFNAGYDAIEWRNNCSEFARWRAGMTGFPLVDAGMRELNQSGHMHNRLRMITASFLSKHLLIDWRWGERYFAEQLLDYEPASNIGGWQWAAGTGTDAAPYFRIFNPYTQADRFDKDRKYICRWVPEYGSPDYPTPMVEHKAARERALQVYRQALSVPRVNCR